MTTLADRFGRSIALGFWAKHAQAMGALYELRNRKAPSKPKDREVDATLLNLWNGPRRADIEAVILNAEADGRTFLMQAMALCVTELGRKGSPFTVADVKAPPKDPWSISAQMHRLPRDLQQSPLTLSLWLYEDPDSRIMLYADIYVEDNATAAGEMATALRGAYDAASRPYEEWDDGSVVFVELPLLGHVDDVDGAVDFDRLAGALLDRLEAQDNTVLQELATVTRRHRS